MLTLPSEWLINALRSLFKCKLLSRRIVRRSFANNAILLRTKRKKNTLLSRNTSAKYAKHSQKDKNVWVCHTYVRFAYPSTKFIVKCHGNCHFNSIENKIKSKSNSILMLKVGKKFQKSNSFSINFLGIW